MESDESCPDSYEANIIIIKKGKDIIVIKQKKQKLHANVPNEVRFKKYSNTSKANTYKRKKNSIHHDQV